MNPAELAESCAARLNAATKFGQSWDDACIMLTTPKGWKRPPKFPRGKLAQVKEDGTRVWWFNAQNVLAWLAGNGLIAIQIHRDAELKEIVV